MKNQIIFALTLLCANFCNGYTISPAINSVYRADDDIIITVQPHYGLLIVDGQLTFALKSTHNPEDGSLAVPGTNQSHQDGIIHTAVIAKNKKMFTTATRDYHPQNHCSLMSNYIDAKGNIVNVPAGTKIKDVPGIRRKDGLPIEDREQELWPDHGVQNVKGPKGADLLAPIECLANAVINKGINPSIDCYSGFMDAKGNSTGLAETLIANGITRFMAIGYAGDFCVPASYIDGAKLGFEVDVLVNDICSINDANEVEKIVGAARKYKNLKIFVTEEDLSKARKDVADKIQRSGVRVIKAATKSDIFDQGIEESAKTHHSTLERVLGNLTEAQRYSIKEKAKEAEAENHKKLATAYGLLSHRLIKSAKSQ